MKNAAESWRIFARSEGIKGFACRLLSALCRGVCRLDYLNSAEELTVSYPCVISFEMTIYHTGGVFSYLPHHLDLALEDSVGHSTCMSVLERRRAIMGWLVGEG